jgi:antitoxin ParD1/3/4
MSITLKPEQEQFIQSQIQAGRFATAEEAIDVALSLLEQSNEDYAEWVEDTRQKLDVAVAQIERGEVLDGETVMAQLQEKLNKAREAFEGTEK